MTPWLNLYHVVHVAGGCWILWFRDGASCGWAESVGCFAKLPAPPKAQTPGA